MDYKFKTELKKQLLKGRTIKYVSEQIGYERSGLTKILNGKSKCKKLTAYCIVKFCDNAREIENYFIKERN